MSLTLDFKINEGIRAKETFGNEVSLYDFIIRDVQEHGISLEVHTGGTNYSVSLGKGRRHSVSPVCKVHLPPYFFRERNGVKRARVIFDTYGNVLFYKKYSTS